MNLTKIRIKIILFLTLFFGFIGLARSSQAATLTAASCSYADVSASIQAASPGDTILVPAGSATWSLQLLITKGIILKAEGLVNIMGNSGADVPLIEYAPAHPEYDEPFRISGFTFDYSTNNALALRIINGNYLYPLTKIRVDHNKFLNCICENPAPDRHYVTFNIIGSFVFGVFDNNELTGFPCFHHEGGNENVWNNTIFEYGSVNNWYEEDNIFTALGSASSGGFLIAGSGQGGRYVSRYNTISSRVSGSGIYPLYDIHGSQQYGIYAALGAEVYGNIVTSLDPTKVSSVEMMAHRGGKALMFFNRAVDFYNGGSTIQIWEEFADSINPTTSNQPQHVSDSYYWNNRVDTTLKNPILTIDCATGLGHGSSCPGYGCQDDACFYHGIGVGIKENIDWFVQATSFDGTLQTGAGMGCGILASRPATCTTGAGYWATDQSCSSVDTDTVGAHPKTPISGVLYKCTSPNVWTAYYTPYTYPHPLRADCVKYPALCDFDNIPPAAPTGLMVN